MGIPFGFQLWQLGLINHPGSAQLYRKVRMFKIVTFYGGVAAGAYELVALRKQWLYYDRFYPEPTELQKTLNMDAMIFKEQQYTQETTEEKLRKKDDPTINMIYRQMYQLPPQRYPSPDDNPNSVNLTEHEQVS